MNTIPAPKIETVEITRLKPWGKNPRKNHAVDAIARSIEALGYLAPIIVQAGTYRILAGHGRLEALQRLGVQQVPVIVAEISDEKADLYTIADNKLTEAASWDENLLRALVGELKGLDVDLTVTGFSEGELKEIEGLTIDDPALDAEDALVEPEASAITQPGDLWRLGVHRVACGDSTTEIAYRKLLGGEHADLVFTDPPYGVDYKAKKFDLIKNDELKGEKLLSFLAEAFSWTSFCAKDDAAFYIWHASSTRGYFTSAMAMAGLLERQYLIWVKPSLVLGHADYQWQHEPCFYAAKQDGKPQFYGARDQATVWHVAHRSKKYSSAVLGSGAVVQVGKQRLYVSEIVPKSRKIREFRLPPDMAMSFMAEPTATDCWTVGRDAGAEHPTQKPIELARRAIENSSKVGEIVLDPFLGSGSTLIASEVTQRVCRGIELAPQYVDVIVKRWQLLTGEKAQNLTRPEVTIP